MLGTVTEMTNDPIRASRLLAPTQEHCGDGLFASDERCDDSNTANGDGCSAQCMIEVGFGCISSISSNTTGIGFGGLDSCAPICGDGRRVANEGCDDNNVIIGDGCDLNCQVEPGFRKTQRNACASLLVR